MGIIMGVFLNTTKVQQLALERVRADKAWCLLAEDQVQPDP